MMVKTLLGSSISFTTLREMYDDCFLLLEMM